MIKDRCNICGKEHKDRWFQFILGILIGGTIWDLFWIYQIVRLGHGF